VHSLWRDWSNLVRHDNLLAQIVAIALYYKRALLNTISLITLTHGGDHGSSLAACLACMHLAIVFIRCGVIAYFVQRVNSSRCK
jgi:hypothetical protein